MKLPEPLFAIINPLMRLTLRSPLHFMFSSSLMLITFSGRKSGKLFTTPVRYMRVGNKVSCFTAKTNQWWRNVQANPQIVLRVAGKNYECEASIVTDESERIAAAIRNLLVSFPNDAPYYEIELQADKTPVEKDLLRASENTVLVEAELK